MAPGILFAGQLTDIRLSSGPVATRIVLDLDRPASHRLFALENPDRLVIDLPDTSASASLRLPEPKGRVRAVRTGARPNGALRVVLDLTGRAAPKSFLLGPEGAFGHRLVIDLSDPVDSPVLSRKTTEEYTGRDIVVVIDAGHGGHDPGTTGHAGVHEKDVVLTIAKQLARLLEDEHGIKPVLIRNSDRYVELGDRLRIAHEAQADLFVSIHADWNENRNVKGATVYSIATGRAASETAKRLADRENAGELIGGVSLSDKDDVLARVLLDVAQGWSIGMSNVAGQRVIDRLSSITTMLKPTVQQGNLYVLTSPDIPSLLVETAFLSNPKEESRLRDPGYQKIFARALFAGILDYFRTNAPPESYLAHNPPPEDRGPIRHVIARGETLSEIAEHYRVSLRELRRTNAINGDIIRIGQVLTIPTS
jgi:N-acetylmuramoyl-L-alanine amidase